MIVKVAVTCFWILGNRELKAVLIPLHTSFCLVDDDTDVHDDAVGVEDGTGKSLRDLNETDVVILHN